MPSYTGWSSSVLSESCYVFHLKQKRERFLQWYLNSSNSSVKQLRVENKAIVNTFYRAPRSAITAHFHTKCGLCRASFTLFGSIKGSYSNPNVCKRIYSAATPADNWSARQKSTRREQGWGYIQLWSTAIWAATIRLKTQRDIDKPLLFTDQ